MKSLYEIIEEIRSTECGDEDGVLDLEKLNSLNISRNDKIDNIACYIKNLRAEAKMIEPEAKKLVERKKAKEARADSLEEYLENMMLSSGLTKFETARTKISFRRSERTEIQEEDFLNWVEENSRQDLLRIKKEISKKAIEEALKTEAIPFVDIVEYQNIQIK